MMFTERHEQDLAELKALHREFGERAAEVLEQIKRIQKAHPKPAAQDQRQASAVVEGDDAGPLLAFVHIPKTAGGTVIAMLAAAYSKTGIGKTGNYMKGPERMRRARSPGDRGVGRGGSAAVGE